MPLSLTMSELFHETPPYPQAELVGELPLSERRNFNGKTHDDVVRASILLRRLGPVDPRLTHRAIEAVEARRAWAQRQLTEILGHGADV